MKYPHLAARLYNAALMVSPDKATVIEQVFRAHLLGEAKAAARPEDFARPDLEASLGSIKFQPRSDKPYPITQGGVAIIQIVGTLVQRGDSLDAMSGLIGYNRIERQLAAALDDDAVKGVVLEIDSPGGEANGCFDLAKRIVEARKGGKPVWAAANEQAFSAAYALACAAERLTVPPTGMVGSIGVIALHVDQSKRDFQQGYAYTAVYAGARKNDFSSHEPLSKTAEGILHAEVERLYGIFVNHVAIARGIDVKVVRATEAGLLNPDVAKANGFVDGIESFSDTVAALEAKVNRLAGTTYVVGARAESEAPTRADAAHQPQEVIMEEKKPAAPAQDKPAESQPGAAAMDSAKVSADARQAERDRLNGILDCEEAKQRPQLAQHLATKTDMSVDAAKATLAAAAAEAGGGKGQFANAMAKIANPKVGADAGEPAGGDNVVSIDRAGIYEARRPKPAAA